MPQDPLEGFFEGLKISQARRAEQTRSALEWQRQQQDQESKQAEIKLHQDTLTQHKKEFDAAQKVIAAKAALEHMQGMQEITSNIMKGVNVPGSTQQPVAQAPAAQGGGEFSPINPEQASSVTHTLPDGESITVPTLNEQARRSASAYEIANKPKEEATRREKAAEEEARAKQAGESKQADFLRSMIIKSQEDERARLDRESHEMIAKGNNATQLKVAGMRGGLSPEWQNYDPSPHVLDALSGDISREDLSRMTLPPQLKMAIIDGVKSSGGNFLSKDQQKVASEYSGLVDIVKTMDELLTKIPQNTGKGILSSIAATGRGAVAGLDKDITSLEQRLEGSATLIGRAVSKDNRVSDQDAKRVGMGFFPSKSDLIENNVKKRNDYVQRVNGAIDAKLSTIPAAQRQFIKKKLGLDTIPMLPLPSASGANQQQPAAKQPTAAPGATHIWTPQGIQLIQQQQQ